MSFYADHGTKILGACTAMVGAAQVGLPTLISDHVMTQSNGTLAQFLLGIAAAGLGGLTVAKGFNNSAAQAAQGAQK